MKIRGSNGYSAQFSDPRVWELVNIWKEDTHVGIHPISPASEGWEQRPHINHSGSTSKLSDPVKITDYGLCGKSPVYHLIDLHPWLGKLPNLPGPQVPLLCSGGNTYLPWLF